MRRRVLSFLPLCLLALPSAPPAGGAEKPALEEKVAGLERKEGLLTFHVDRKAGAIWLELPAGDAQGTLGSYLYVEGLLTGLGSNPVGLDRGQLGDTRVVTFRRLGGKVLLEQPNLRYRAQSANSDEVRAVHESFARSVLWGAEIAAEAKDGRVLVDFTPFLLRDAHDVVATMKRTGQGTFSLDTTRSGVDPSASLAFPDNVEFEALLTFTSGEPGELVRDTAPTAQAVTLVAHHSFVRLPDAGYRPRAFDPRSGYFAIEFADYAVPLAAPLDTRWIVRHRAVPGKPIVYYVDSGAPEPVRSALIEGASWWAAAFEAAGLPGAYRVEVLPPGAHPLDVRYNVIQWVHRATRGWSYGGGVVDPRTGEMIKGHVTLGSLRVRHDRLLFEGLVGADQTGRGGAQDPIVASLARIRQLAAHEVGHTLGLAHNFAASTYGRESVMDYPAPLVRRRGDGSLDLSEAYTTGAGRWDVQAIRYGYTRFATEAEESAGLAAILAESEREGWLFLTDEDARSAGAAHPLASLWDNGPDPAAALVETLAIRAAALERFGARSLAPGRPLALLEEVLAPLYFHHRYQLQAAAKAIGGLEYSYAVRGAGGPVEAVPVAAARQRQALQAVLAALDPRALDLPEPVLRALLPRPAGFGRSREQFATRTEPAFDALGAAATAARMVVDELTQPERSARLVDFHRRDPALPGLDDVLQALVTAAFVPAGDSGRLAEVRRAVQGEVVGGLVRLAENGATSTAVRARAESALADLENRLAAPGGDPHRAFLAAEIARHQSRQRGDAPAPSPAPPPPPGQPIGAWAFHLADEECGWSLAP
jgi:hypothetical protein